MKAYVIAAAFGLKSTTDRCAAGSVRGNNREYSLRPNILLDPKSFPGNSCLFAYSFLSLLSRRYLFSYSVYYQYLAFLKEN